MAYRRLLEGGKRVDHCVGLQTIDRSEQGPAVHDVGDQWLGAERAQPVALARRPAQADHLVAGREQLTGQRNSQGAARTCDQYFHIYLLRVCKGVSTEPST